ncbi:MAG TPA: exodeoxyribonuclease VII large subunit [Capillimicrobium sp.]|nr:exodeoxyribonuclease VII large subunit [Capillimicrobium sp.]
MSQRPEGIPGSSLKGPFPVGAYADKLRAYLRERARVQLFGEVFNLRIHKVSVFFELRDGDGALPCRMWRDDFDRLGVTLEDGASVVVAGGPDFYPGSRTSSPHFSFAVTGLRLAGEGDLLAQLDLLRKKLDAEGLFAPQKALPRPALPRTIGVVTGEGGKARDDVLAGLRRRGWAGRLVWAFAPVQDRRAAPAITRALQDLAACGEVDVIVVARGGGSLADLLCFCDETLCRTVALLPVPVIASVGHHTDRTILDDVAAVSCSTPTHAAETAVPFHCAQAREALARFARRLDQHGRRAVLDRARVLARLSRAPAQHVARHRSALHQSLRELRAAGRRGVASREALAATHAVVLARKGAAASAEARRAATLERLRLALDAHDPERTLERGFALVESRDGGVVTSAAAAREAGAVRLRFSDAAVDATISQEARHA